MRVQTEEWRSFIPGVRMYKDKKTLFWNGEKLWEGEGFAGRALAYDEYEERQTWEVIIVLPGVEVIPEWTFHCCRNVKKVIMADSVRRIEEKAFYYCPSLELIRLSRSLEYIGKQAFLYCTSLPSIFIPPSCREIATFAFEHCKKLLIFGLPQNVELGAGVFKKTAVLDASLIEFKEDGYYTLRNNGETVVMQWIGHDSEREEEAVQWIKSINNGDTYSLHRACASYNPLSEVIHSLVKRHGIKAMRMKNTLGITPLQYLEANTYADISEKEIMNRYILDSMGEVL